MARSFEAFKYLNIWCISALKRKTLPEIAKIVGLDNHQSLHHFLTTSPWDVEQLRALRLELILQVLKERPIILIIDRTGDKNKGDKTDYVKRQYIGNLGKTENGIVVVTALHLAQKIIRSAVCWGLFVGVEGFWVTAGFLFSSLLVSGVLRDDQYITVWSIQTSWEVEARR